MKKALIISGMVIVSLLVLSLVFASSVNNNSTNNNSTNVKGTNYSRCILSCVNISQFDKANCIADSKNISGNCNEKFKNCIFDIKNLTNFSKKDLIKIIKDCNKNFTICKKNTNSARDSCLKDVINDSKICKDSCKEVKACTTNYNPVCGKDNITYSNECELKKAGVEKDCDKECPCFLFVSDFYTDDSICYSCGMDCTTKPNQICPMTSLSMPIFNFQCKIIDGKCTKIIENQTINNSVCGNGVCEEGEKDYPGGCGPNADPRCLGPPARAGICPEDCKNTGKSALVQRCISQKCEDTGAYCEFDYQCPAPFINNSINYYSNNNSAMGNHSDNLGKYDICFPCGDSCIKTIGVTSCIKPDGSFRCEVINNICTKILLVNNEKTCTSNSECSSGYICIRYVKGMTNLYGGVYGTYANPGKCIIEM